MDKITVAKNVVQIVSGLGVSRVISSIVANNVATVTITQKVCVWTATAVAGAMAADAMGNYTDEKIDEIVTWYDKKVKR